MSTEETILSELPDPDGGRRFLTQLADTNAVASRKLLKNDSLLSDVLTLVAFSPLLAATLLQDPDLIGWLDRERRLVGIRSKADLLESLARFSMTNSQVEPQVVFARFRRRELLRIYLRDIRRLATIAEITEELSNLADAILETALELGRHEVDKRFGFPQETDENGRLLKAQFCVVALGKLGSRELNYSSDIDLLFLYSNEGSTSGAGSRGQVTNREYFVKLAEIIIKYVGQQTGEGAAYRVDLRLRPHGRLGALALSVNDAVSYYSTEARPWERQVLIRSRASAGDPELFKIFFSSSAAEIFETNASVEDSLQSVKRSKQQIDIEHVKKKGFNVKLGSGGIREIEFIAQALQLAYGGRDQWVRSPHTLISLSRLADRNFLNSSELTELFDAYNFLRQTEHVLQMENGVQTHTLPDEINRRTLLVRRMEFCTGTDFETSLTAHTKNVSRIFKRVLDNGPSPTVISRPGNRDRSPESAAEPTVPTASIDPIAKPNAVQNDIVDQFAAISPHFAVRMAAMPQLVTGIRNVEGPISSHDFALEIEEAVRSEKDFGRRLAILRRTWSRIMLEIAVADAFERISIPETKTLQTELAESSIKAAIEIVKDRLEEKHQCEIDKLDMAVLALGKLGGRGLDYDSDLDLLIVYDDSRPIPPPNVTHNEFYGRAVEIFITVLSSMTRDGHLYRVDLRLRPYGKNGPSAIGRSAFEQYMTEESAIWELLAFVKLRAVGGWSALANEIEATTRKTIHERALLCDPGELRSDTLRIRLLLQKQRTRRQRSDQVNIKYGPGGMLDIYFAMRFLQLRDNVPDDWTNRSTPFMLERLFEKGSLPFEVFNDLKSGYDFLAELDHNLRLTIGRTSLVPLNNDSIVKIIAMRMKYSDPTDLLGQLSLVRVSIRSAFEAIMEI